VKAIIYRAYGAPDVLRYEDIEKPTAGDDDVLIKIRAASVNPLDWHFMRGTPYFVRIMTGLRTPKAARLGVDAAGEVETVGRSVTRFKPGDEVFGACRGAFAEYACARQSSLAMKASAVTFEQAASVPIAASTALQGLRDKGRIQPGQKALINGAAGGVGTFAVQMAASFGAHVTGVCSTRNVEMVRSLGAERVIDYTAEDFTKGTHRYDLVLDAVGNHSFSAWRRILTPNGICVAVGAPGGPWMIGAFAGAITALVSSRFMRKKAVSFVATVNPDDLAFTQDLIVAAKIAPVIDRHYPLNELPDAIRYLEEGHACGKVVVDVHETRTSC
jgi:NADPH:quinone reductase-like Zn-dependent oxidoreductase